jgi:hypothetical protein
MDAYPRRSRIPLATRVLWLAALLVICSGATAIAAVGSSKPQLAGTWSGKYSGAFSGTFRLQWTQARSKLSGSITLSNPKGKYAISGSVHGSAINFGAVGAGATYKGSVSGKTMSGSYQTAQGGGRWSAHKCKTRMVC